MNWMNWTNWMKLNWMNFEKEVFARKLRFHIFHFHFLRDVSHESFVFTSSAFCFWGNSRMKASFSRLHFQIFREVPHEGSIFTSSSFSFTFWGKSRTKASFSHLPLSDFQGLLARKLRFHIFHFHFLRDVSHESFVFTSSAFSFLGKPRTKYVFWEIADARNALFCGTNVPRKMGGEACPAGGCGTLSVRVGSCSDRPRGGTVQFRRHFDNLNLNFQNLKVSHESFVFTFATFTFWGRSRTKASFSHLPLSLLEGSLARKLRFHILHLGKVSRESFVLTSSTVGIWGEVSHCNGCVKVAWSRRGCVRITIFFCSWTS